MKYLKWIRNLVAFFAFILICIVGVYAVYGTVLFCLEYIKYLHPLDTEALNVVESPLDLALVAAAIGGFILVAPANLKDKLSTNYTKHAANTTAILFLASATSFALTAMLIRLVKAFTENILNWAEWGAIYATDIFIVIASFTFGFGIMYALIATAIYIYKLITS